MCDVRIGIRLKLLASHQPGQYGVPYEDVQHTNTDPLLPLHSARHHCATGFVTRLAVQSLYFLSEVVVRAQVRVLERNISAKSPGCHG